MAPTPDDDTARHDVVGQPALPTPPADSRVVALRDVTKRHPSGAGLAEISLDVAGDGLTVVAGRAGAGVSTLLSIVACAERADSGEVWVAGVDVATATRAARREHRRRALGMVLSDPDGNLLPGQTAGANLTWSAKRRTGAMLNTAGIDAHLAMVDLEGTARTRVAEMTRGERQRLALACALVGEPRLVVADDPTVTLDRAEANRFVVALRTATDRGTSILAGTTDPVLLAAADHFVHLVDGRLA